MVKIGEPEVVENDDGTSTITTTHQYTIQGPNGEKTITRRVKHTRGGCLLGRPRQGDQHKINKAEAVRLIKAMNPHDLEKALVFLRM